MEFIIKEETANKILNYLVKQPFIEVSQLIGELQQLKPLTPKEEPTE